VDAPEKPLASPSLRSLRLTAISGDKREVGTATGFIVTENERLTLLTNLHVASGRHPVHGSPLHGASLADLPHFLRVTYPRNDYYPPHSFTIPLVDQNLDPTYLKPYTTFSSPLEHSSHAGDVLADELPDVAWLRVPDEENSRCKALAYAVEAIPENLSITDPLYIVGYPRYGGYNGRILPVWSRGSVATEPSVGWKGPRFLVDSRTRPGQSGSPVIVYRKPMVFSSPGGISEDLPEVARLVGIYSGRVDKDSDLGSVWTSSALTMQQWEQ
jgi:hypothetical protein